MADEAVTTPAESSTAETKPAAEFTVPTDPKAYAEWRQTGRLPGDDRPSKGEVPATSKIKSGDEESETAPDSETGKPTGRNAETRIKQLASERDTFRTERDQYKAKLEALETGKTDAKAGSSTAPAKDAKAASSPAPDGRPVKPNQDDFDGWDAWEAARDKYWEDVAEWKVAQRLDADRQRHAQSEMEEQNRQRLEEAKARYGNEAEARILDTAHAVFEDKAIVDPIKQAIARSKVMVDALYVLGSDAKEFAEFVKLAKGDPLEAMRKWFTVEGLVQQELAKGGKAAAAETPARGPDGKFLPPPKKSAPAPPLELNGNATPVGDQSARAVAAGNFAAFKEDRDRKDLLRFKGQ